MGDSAIQVRPATPDDVRPVALTLARAFYDDPQFVWALPKPASRLRRLRRFFFTLLSREAMRRGGVEVALIDGKVAGAAVWTPPGLWAAEITVSALFGYLRAFGRRMGYGSTLGRETARVHPHEKHWYLYVIGVEPEFQGHGVGAALLRSRLRECDEQALPAYLESSKLSNVPIYEHFGFTVTGTVPLPEDAPVLTMMWRPAPEVGADRSDAAASAETLLGPGNQ